MHENHQPTSAASALSSEMDGVTVIPLRSTKAVAASAGMSTRMPLPRSSAEVKNFTTRKTRVGGFRWG